MRKYFILAIGLAAYVLTAVVVYFLYIQAFKINVVFYSALYSALIAVVIFSIGVWLLPVFSIFVRFEKINMIFTAILVGYILAISLPTVIDRSLSFYILEKLQQRGGGIQLDKFSYIFTDEYVREHKLVDVRLTEQEESGTIVIRDGCVHLTERGYALANFSRFFRSNFLPEQRLLRGEYTDALIDPFKRSDLNPDYLCK